MLLSTYERVIKLFSENHGYVNAGMFKDAGFSTIQIKELVENGKVEKISHGNYWFIDKENGKPDNYRMIEACMVNSKAVICADSACFLHGLLDAEPENLSVATLKTDRARMKFNFPIKRHYYSDVAYEEDIEEIETESGVIRVYGVERSVCDAIRFRADIGEDVVDRIVTNYLKTDNKKLERMFAYADAMRVGKIVRTRIESCK